jgi:Tfp pilus assembly protein FimT
LIEMLVVLAILAGLAAFSWPSVRTMIRKNDLRAAAKQLRSVWAKARLDAIEFGQVQRFRFQPGSGVYEIRGLADPGASDDSSASTQSTQVGSQRSSQVGSRSLASSGGNGAAHDEGVESMPSGIEFAQPASQDDAILTRGEMTTVSDGTWSEPVLFFPNGRTSNATVRLRGQNKSSIEVVLRGLTGSVAIGEIAVENNPLDDRSPNPDKRLGAAGKPSGNSMKPSGASGQQRSRTVSPQRETPP